MTTVRLFTITTSALSTSDEIDWLAARFAGGYGILGRARVRDGSPKTYDRWMIEVPGGDRYVIFFDISDMPGIVAPAGQVAPAGSPTSGAWLAGAAFVGLVAMIWLTRPAPRAARR